MQIRSSLTQLWRESRANPGFTALYIGGVAFAVAFTMIYAIIYYVNLAPIYPEYKRNSINYLKTIKVERSQNGYTYYGGMSRKFIDTFIKDSENIDCYSTSVTYLPDKASISGTTGKGKALSAVKQLTDQNFFKIYDYEFLAGRPFDENEIKAEQQLFPAVITGEIAERIFGSPENAVGKEINIDHKRYKVSGVIRRGSPVSFISYADVVLPYTSSPEHFNPKEKETGTIKDYMGTLGVTLNFADATQKERFTAEYTEKIRRINLNDKDEYRIITDSSLPVDHYVAILGTNITMERSTLGSLVRPLIIMLLVLLIVPAINISGMIGGQMERRMAEIGVRRSFGATRRELTRQVMFENLVLTLAGGLIGLIFAWSLIIMLRKLLLMILVPGWNVVDAPIEISAEMLFSPAIFFATLAICLILNLLSAYIPIRMSLRHPIVSSLNTKR